MRGVVPSGSSANACVCCRPFLSVAIYCIYLDLRYLRLLNESSISEVSASTASTGCVLWKQPPGTLPN